MNTTFLKPLAFLFLVLVLLSCEKENTDTIISDLDKDEISTINALVEQAKIRFLNGDVNGGDDNTSFRVENEGLIDEYTANSTDFSRPQNNVFLACLRSVEPNQEQRPLLGRALQAYSERNERIIKAHRQNIHNLKLRMENARQQLYSRFEAGEITREQYHQQITRLRKLYQESLDRVKTSHADAFSRSYNLLLTHITKILGNDQWEMLTGCIRK
jgi:hypothetical protein